MKIVWKHIWRVITWSSLIIASGLTAANYYLYVQIKDIKAKNSHCQQFIIPLPRLPDMIPKQYNQPPVEEPPKEGGA